jgi:hypothetical protein
MLGWCVHVTFEKTIDDKIESSHVIVFWNFNFDGECSNEHILGILLLKNDDDKKIYK